MDKEKLNQGNQELSFDENYFRRPGGGSSYTGVPCIEAGGILFITTDNVRSLGAIIKGRQVGDIAG